MNNEKQDRRILIVDDEPENIRAITREIRPWTRRRGIEVDSCSNGEEALEILDAREYGVIVTDNRMPRMNGTDLVKLVGRNHPATVSIILTGYTEKRDMEAALNSGIFAFLIKPWDSEQLRLEIQKAMGVHYMRKRHLEETRRQKEELRMAAAFHAQLFRITPPPVSNGISITYARDAAGSMGFTGDYLDIVPIGTTGHLILIGDVSGHGLRTTFVLAMLKGVITPQYLAERRMEGSTGEILQWINARFCEINREIPDLFVTFTAVYVETATGRVTYASAGNPMPLLVGTDGVHTLENYGVALGVDPDAVYRETTLMLTPGESVYFFTDGISFPMQGEDRIDPETLSVVLREERDQAPATVIARLKERIGSETIGDDITLVRVANEGGHR
ncbi:MAG: PP2C family protein-serine/threonine phosphatase [Alkalispirochaeta sp.]